MQPLLALALLVQAPAADTTQVRDGLYIGFSLGPAMVGISCQECDSKMGAEFSGQLSGGLGVVASDHLTVGLQLNAWGAKEQMNGIWATSVVATWYPSLTSGAFIRPNLGLASFSGREIVDGPDEHGKGYIAGLTIGTDLRFDKKLSFTPTLTFQYADIGDTSLGGLAERSGVESWVVGLGFGLTWH